MCLLFFYSLFILFFISVCYPRFFALILGPLFPSAPSFHLVPPLLLSASRWYSLLI